MLLTHEQAHAAYKIMELASAGGVDSCRVRYGVVVMAYNVGHGCVTVIDPRNPVESHASLGAFAHAYDIDGCATLEKYRAAVADWEAFCAYHAPANHCAPCTREQFDSLSPAGRLTKMILGVWA